MSLKPSIWQIVNPFFLQDWQDANPSAVSYPLNVADGVKGWSSAVDPLSLDIAGLPAGTLATTTELAINNGAVNEKTTLSDLATFLGGGGTPSDLAVKVATTAVLPWTPTYDNGTSGVGATLTRSSNGTTGAIDGVAAASLVAGDYILVKNQAAQLQNGVYEITQQGTASLPYILTRVTEADTSAELDDLVVTAALGTTNKGIPYGQQTNNPIIGTNNIVFTATGIYMRQQTSGTQAINQIPVYTATGLTQTKGTANFKYNPANDLFTIRGIDYTFPANNGDASQVLTTDGAGNLSWATGGRDVYSVADITALNAITGMDTGDVAIVANTFDDTGENVSWSYIYNGTSWLLQSWYNVYLNTLLDVNAPSPVAWDILQWDGTQWVNVANAFAPLNWTPTEVRYFDNAGVDFSDPLFTRDSVTNHTEATREYGLIVPTNTGFRTEPIQFPWLPFPLEASALVSFDWVDKAAIWVFDLTPFWQENWTPAIMKFYGDGSQATFSMAKTLADMSVFDTVTGKSANLSLNPQINNIWMSWYDWTTNYWWNATPNSFDYQTNGNAFKLPISFNWVWSVVADLSGNGILTLEPISSLINKATQIGTDWLWALFTGTVFTLPQISSFIYWVYVNWQYQSNIVDYTVTGTDITFLTALSWDLVTVVYEYL